MDVAGRQIHASLKATTRSLDMISPNAFTSLPDFTRDNVKHFVNAEKALIDTVIKRPEPRTASQRRVPRTIKVKTASRKRGGVKVKTATVTATA